MKLRELLSIIWSEDELLKICTSDDDLPADKVLFNGWKSDWYDSHKEDPINDLFVEGLEVNPNYKIVIYVTKYGRN